MNVLDSVKMDIGDETFSKLGLLLEINDIKIKSHDNDIRVDDLRM